jgi:predicted deacylase
MIITDARALKLDPGQSVRAWLGVGHSWFGPVQVPLFVARGRSPGPKLVVIAAQHPDEVYGVLGCLDFINEVRVDGLRGEVWVLPCMNVVGYITGSRMSPFDHQDMNRVFPGRAEGTITEQTARAFLDQVLPGADLLLDLHGGSVENGNWAFGRWTDAPGKPSAYPIVRAMDVNFLVSVPDTTAGSLGAVTPQAGVPQISIEAGWCARYPRENAIQMSGYITTAMRCLGQIDGPKPSPRDLPFKKTASVRARVGGAWKTFVSMGDDVEKGQHLGVVMDLLGNVVQTAVAVDDGTVCVMRTGVRVHPGESLVTIGVAASAPDAAAR